MEEIIKMPLKGGKVARPLSLLSDDQLCDIYLASVEVLERVGLEAGEERALEVLEEAGADVERRSGLVRIPEHLVREAVKSAPSRVTLCGRTADRDVKVEGKRVFFGAGANALYVLDPSTGRVREATTQDCVNAAILADALENIHCYLSLVSPQDVPPEGVDRVKCAIALKNTTKHFFHDAQGREGAEDQIRMAAAVVGGIEELRRRPLLSLAPCVTSPLRWGKDALEVLIAMAEHGLPQIISSEPMSGATSPASLAGSLVQQCAEVIGGLVIAQLVSRGTPVLVCTLPTIMDMRTGNIAMGSVEMGLMCAAMAQIMRRHGIPYVGSGGMADSKVMDEQAAYEKAMTCLLAALAGTNLIHLSAGMLEAILTFGYEQLVIDDEIIGMVMRAMQGIQVDDVLLAVDVIERVGPGGHFLAQDHTRRLFRREHFIPSLTDRRTRKDWERSGSLDIVARARGRVDEILRSHRPEPLERSVREEIDRIAKEAQRRLSR
ncbi:TPA: hypothetical protein EYP44_01600 [Candidatus Bathyarchaeota archaeon]|nr:hypothetical protein [Candidatus Bathyarchaeota archaeon]